MASMDEEWALRPGGIARSGFSRMLAPGPGLVSMLVHGTGLVFRLAFMLLLLRYGSSEVLGHYGLLVAIEVVVIYVAGLEFHTFTTRRYARRPSPGKLRVCAAAHRRMFYVSLPLAAALTIGALAFLRVRLPYGDVATFTAVVLTGVVSQEVIRYLVLVEKPVHAVLVVFLRGAAWQPLVVPFLDPTPHTIHVTVIAWGALSAVATVWGLLVMRHAISLRTRPRLGYLVRGLSASRGYFVVASASVIQGNLERFVLQLMLGPSAVGVFSFFQTLANTLPALIQSAILNVSLGQLLTSFGQRLPGRAGYLRALLRRSLKASFLISALICVVAVPLVFVTANPEYLRLLWMLPVLLVGQTLMMWTQPIHLALYGAHHDRTLMVLSLSALAASLLLNYAMVGAIGLSGAVLAPLIIGAALAAARWRLLSSLRATQDL
jgi:O-antigen/teichoic acid export membrane protein